MPTAITFGSIAARAFGFLSQVLRKDALFNYVTLLLTGNGTNGAQNNTFLDSSSNNFTITRNGGVTQGSFSPYGPNWSNYFGGNQDYLTLPSNTALIMGTGQFWFEAWIFMPAAPATQYVVLGTNDNTLTSSALTVRIQPSALRVDRHGVVAYDSSTVSWQYNTWQHIAVGRDSGNTLRFFVNGTAVGTRASTTDNFSGNCSAIGAIPIDGFGNEFNGYISNLRLLKGTCLHTASFTPSTTPLTAITNTSLLTCQSSRFVDNSSNNFAVTQAGGVSIQRFSPFVPPTAYSSTINGGSGYFGGSGNYLSIAYNSALELGTGDFTVEGWFYLPSSATLVDGQVSLICAGRQDTSLGGWNINAFDATGSSSLRLEKCLTNGTTVEFVWTVSSTNGVQRNAWIHYAVVRNSGTTTAYWNGASLGSTANFNGVDLPIPGSRSTFIGAGADATGPTRWPYTGFMSSVRIVKGTAVYTSGFTPPTAPLSAITNTSLLLNFTNGGIIDNAMMNDLETVGNAQISTSVSKFGGGSMAFDGNGDYLRTPDGPNTELGSGDFTLECWVNFNSLPASNGHQATFVSKWAANNGSYEFYLYNNAGTQQLYLTYSTNGTAGTNLGVNWTPATGVWYHIACVRNGGNLTFWVNGTQQGATQTISGTLFDGSAGIEVGGFVAGSANTVLNGYIDDLRITKGYARYTANFTPPGPLPLY